MVPITKRVHLRRPQKMSPVNAQLFQMMLTVCGWGHSCLCAKHTRKRALIIETAFEGDGSGGVIGGDEVLAGGADALADEVAHGRLAEQLLEEPRELALGQMGERGELPGLDDFAKAGVQMAQRGLELLKGLRDAADFVHVVEHEADTADLAFGVSQG